MTTYSLPNNSVVKVHDIFDPLPEFMNRADMLFIDIPYNQSLLTNFGNREGVILSPNNPGDFQSFIVRIGDCIELIGAEHSFVEVGKNALADIIFILRDIYKYVTFYNASYYHRAENKCYIIHATDDYKNRRYSVLEDKDESDIVKWLCNNLSFDCIGDLCMGQGLVGLAAYEAGKPFVGTELNERRLANLLQKLAKKGAIIEKGNAYALRR